MKTIRTSLLCLLVLLLTAPLLRAQDLSKYRNFNLGMSLATLLNRTDQKMADVKTIHSRPALIQELTWWPPNIPGPSYRPDTVEQIVFSLYNGELYKMSVTYDRAATEGLTADDMVKSISAQYGPATNLALAIDSSSNDTDDSKHKVIASWENPQYSFDLVRSPFSGVLGLDICSKRVNPAAELASTDAVKMDEQDAPQIEAARQKKQVDDLEVARQKNQKAFRP